MIRTWKTDPLKIAIVSRDTFPGALGVTFAPGKQDPHSASGAWARDLAVDLDAIVAWKARAMVTLIEPHGFELLGIPSLGDEVSRRGMDWLHLPIRDVSIPNAAFKTVWPEHSKLRPDRMMKAGNEHLDCPRRDLRRADERA